MCENIVEMDESGKLRCSWVTADMIYIDYHDNEWGKPIHDSQLLFESLCLEGMQAGLSWVTILKKRDNYRDLFDHFNAEKIARYSAYKVDTLLKNKGIIRNRLKVEAIINNAKCYIRFKQEKLNFSNFLWSFIAGKPRPNHWHDASQVPTTTVESEAMSCALKKRGFKFVGPTICYAFMQAVGMVNDHTQDCFLFPGS
jgi:DNA-3-methyladenine glycosylase I